jgi:hypothetical protein
MPHSCGIGGPIRLLQQTGWAAAHSWGAAMDKPDAAAPVPHDISQSTDEPFNLAAITFAMGDAPEIALPATLDMQIAPPPNNAIDSNRVFIGGSGPIRSFGQAYPGMVGEYGQPYIVTKKITYQPDPGQTITLQHNPPALTLLGGINRDITGRCFGEVQSDEDGNWEETRFTQDNASPILSGGLIAIITYTASATITIPANAQRAWVRMWGPSGASGAAESGTLCGSAGVGSGGYLEKFLTGLVPGKTLIYTRGAAGVPTNSAGGNASDSTLASGTQTIATLTAGGSHGTALGMSIPTAGSVGGVATGGDINRAGQNGGWSLPIGGDVPTMIPGAGGVMGLARGPDGTQSTTLGNAGFPGGLVIAWFNNSN